MIPKEGTSTAKGRLLKPAHELGKAIEDAIKANDAVVAVVTWIADWAETGRILCTIGTMQNVEVTVHTAEEINLDDVILVRKMGRGPTQRWVFAGWLWGPTGGGSGGIIPVLRPESIPAHAANHQDGGADEINVGGLSGDLADAQDPKAHGSSHQDGGSDEINVAGLSGELADGQTPKSHANSHQNGGGDEISVAGLSGVLADQQDASKIKGVDVIDTAIGDGKVLVYRSASGDLVYEAQAGGGDLVIHLVDKDSDGDYDGYTSTNWDGDSFSSGFGTINWNTEFGVPANAKAVFAYIYVRDSDPNAPYQGGSFQIKAKSSSSQWSLGVASRANDIWDDIAGWIPISAAGTSYYGRTASGVGTAEIYIRVTMYAT